MSQLQQVAQIGCDIESSINLSLCLFTSIIIYIRKTLMNKIIVKELDEKRFNALSVHIDPMGTSMFGVMEFRTTRQF